jgi:hypothetical protein
LNQVKTEFKKRIPPKIREGVFNGIRGKNAGLLRRGYNYGALGREITRATKTPSIRTLYVGVSTPPGPTLKRAAGSGSTE